MKKDLTPREIVDKLREYRDKDTKTIIDFLKEYKNVYLSLYIRVLFDKSVVMDAPDVPEYRPSPHPEGMEETSLWMEAKSLYIFESGAPITEKKRKEHLLRILSMLSEKDGKFYLDVLHQNIVLSHITKDILDVVFPGLILEYDFERHLNKPKDEIELL